MSKRGSCLIKHIKKDNVKVNVIQKRSYVVGWLVCHTHPPLLYSCCARVAQNFCKPSLQRRSISAFHSLALNSLHMWQTDIESKPIFI